MAVLPENASVLVVGAGPTGLSLAIMLRRQGVDVVVVDKLPQRLPWSRALGLHARSLEILDALGVLEPVREQSLVLQAVQVHNDQGPLFRLDLTRLDAPFPQVLSCPQSAVEACLEARLRELGGVIHRNTELAGFRQDADGVTARLHDATGWRDLRCRLLVGCDGARSRVREQLELGFEGVAYPDHFLLADLDIDWSLDEHVSHGFLLPEGALIAMPMPEGWRLIINQPAEQVEQTGEPDLAPFRERLRQALGTAPALDNVRWLSRFSIHRRLATRYRRNRVLLAGDACHIQSPLGAQGMNTGIADAFNLGWKLALYLDGVGGGALLDSYERERRPVARTMLNSVDVLSRTSFARNRLLRNARDSFLRLVTGNEALGRRLLRRASQLDVGYPHSPLVESAPGAMGRGAAGPRPGDRMPDARLVYPDGIMNQRLQGLLRSPRHHLIVHLPDHGHQGLVTVYALADRMLNEFGGFVAMTVVVPSPVDPQLGELTDYGVQVLVDRHGEFRQRYGSAGFWLMRPDGHLAWRGPADSADHLLDYLQRTFRRP